jgi:fluoroacetyl-CoA thioesterase
VPHLLPESPEFAALPGNTLTVTTELAEVAGRQLTFTITAADDAGTVCQGTHQRTIIDRTRFDGRLAARTATAENISEREE